jgi:hypothetical protein
MSEAIDRKLVVIFPHLIMNVQCTAWSASISMPLTDAMDGLVASVFVSINASLRKDVALLSHEAIQMTFPDYPMIRIPLDCVEDPVVLSMVVNFVASRCFVMHTGENADVKLLHNEVIELVSELQTNTWMRRYRELMVNFTDMGDGMFIVEAGVPGLMEVQAFISRKQGTVKLSTFKRYFNVDHNVPLSKAFARASLCKVLMAIHNKHPDLSKITLLASPYASSSRTIEDVHRLVAYYESLGFTIIPEEAPTTTTPITMAGVHMSATVSNVIAQCKKYYTQFVKQHS